MRRLVSPTDGSVYDDFVYSYGGYSESFVYYITNDKLEKLESFYYSYVKMTRSYQNDEVIQTNVRVHFIKHF